MRFTFHIGMHCTDEDRALRCLAHNGATLARHKTHVARPGRFRPELRRAMLELKGTPASQDAQERVLRTVMGNETAEHVLFSSDSFLCVPQRAINEDQLYPLVSQRAPWIRNLFPDAPVRFCLALRNPATLIPALQARFAEEESFEAFLARIWPESLSWPDMLARLLEAVPDAEVIVWCNEDAPLLWDELLRLLADLPETATLEGADGFLAELIQPEGLTRMQGYLASHPARSTTHRRRVTAAFLDKFARTEAFEIDYDLPGWTADRLSALTEAYEAQIARVSRMDGIRFIEA
ncbi:MAG: hypothetical protein AAFR47_20595 [Pseudomonadota bacterium]